VADELIAIDGSQGLGGGQILRTCLGLAAATGRAFRITNIRAGRPRPGLAPQHLAAVRAAAAICGAEVSGDRIGSAELTFRPGRVRPGQYAFDIGTAGSTVLLLQAIIPALAVASGDSQVSATGGTHNPMAPCFEYLRDVFGLLASAAGLQAYFELKRPGFYPAGGGKVLMQVQGLASPDQLEAVRLTSRGELKRIEGISAAGGGLPNHIAHRQCAQVLARLGAAGHRATVEQVHWDSDSPGTVVFLRAVFARTVAGFFSLGQRGKPAERVADEAADQLLAFLASPGVVDAHAADQLITILALCPRESRLVTERITDHLLTNAQVVRQLLGRNVSVEGAVGQPGMVSVQGR
jgi:RNA 3'-terminal phosphate cyclase (ATP)